MPAAATMPGEFACEWHLGPGSCDEECLELAQGMYSDGRRHVYFDPTGQSYTDADYEIDLTVFILWEHTVLRTIDRGRFPCR